MLAQSPALNHIGLVCTCARMCGWFCAISSHVEIHIAPTTIRTELFYHYHNFQTESPGSWEPPRSQAD